MFDVGFAELFLLSLIGLLVLGPERLPAVARTLGGFVRKARMSYHNLKRTVEAELAAAEMANPIKEAKEELESVQKQVKALGERLDEKIDTPDKPEPGETPTQALATVEDPAPADETPVPVEDPAEAPETNDGERDEPRPTTP